MTKPHRTPEVDLEPGWLKALQSKKDSDERSYEELGDAMGFGTNTVNNFFKNRYYTLGVATGLAKLFDLPQPAYRLKDADHWMIAIEDDLEMEFVKASRALRKLNKQQYLDILASMKPAAEALALLDAVIKNKPL